MTVMNARDTIELQLADGRIIPATIRRRTTDTSPHTGRELQELHGWVTTDDPETHRWLSVALRGQGDGIVRSLDPSGEPAGRWQLSWNSYGETAGVCTYGLILREAEELSLEALIVDGVELHPYEYREEFLEEGLTIWAKMVGSHADVTRINRLIRTRTSFPVTRRGFHNTPREMRLGVAEWSEYEDRIKYRLVLVDHEIGEEMRAELGRIQEENSRSAIGYYANLVDRLAELLIENGTITRSEMDALREGARAQPGISRHEVWRVTDIDLL
ncbi:MAG: hypothetical protein LBG44_05355 [Gemmatimonadota bacterium]|jgi:hypothetical protein|nr:hypothetical protein [Gemmatimonadota bacterium]